MGDLLVVLRKLSETKRAPNLMYLQSGQTLLYNEV